MKKLSYTLVLPVTFLLFNLVTVSWYVLPVDAPESVLTGWPLPYMCMGWHTSLSWQVFLLALVADFCVYFILVWLVVYGLYRFVKKFRVPKVVYGILYTINVLQLVLLLFTVLINTNNIYTATQTFDVEVIDKEVEWI